MYADAPHVNMQPVTVRTQAPQEVITIRGDAPRGGVVLKPIDPAFQVRGQDPGWSVRNPVIAVQEPGMTLNQRGPAGSIQMRNQNGVAMRTTDPSAGYTIRLD